MNGARNYVFRLTYFKSYRHFINIVIVSIQWSICSTRYLSNPTKSPQYTRHLIYKLAYTFSRHALTLNSTCTISSSTKRNNEEEKSQHSSYDDEKQKSADRLCLYFSYIK